MFRDHLVYVPAGGSERKDCRGDEGGHTERQTRAECQDPGNPNPKAGESDLGLKRAVGPAYEPRGHLPEKDVKDKVGQIAYTYWKKHVVREKGFDRDIFSMGFGFMPE